MSFPSPVGGISFTGDYAPSILFVMLYSLLLPVFAYRLLNRRSRNILILSSFFCAVERTVNFSLRVEQIHDNLRNHWHPNVQAYMQMTFGVGVVTMAQDAVYLLRCLLVNATYGSQCASVKQPALVSESDQSVDFVTQDRPRLRFWIRRYTDGATLVYILCLCLGLLAGGLYTAGMKDDRMADVVMILRHVSAALGLLLVVMVNCAVVLARRLLRVNKRGASIIFTHTFLLAITCIYRLSVMYHLTGSITSTLPGSLNTPIEKVAFYVFHVLPEWMSAFVLLAFNVREEFATGPFGDWRWKDETPMRER